MSLLILPVVFLMTGCTSTSTTRVEQYSTRSVLAPTQRPATVAAVPSESESASFSMSTADTRRPSDIREEVNVFTGGGGGIPCESNSAARIVIWNTDDSNQIEVFPMSLSDTSAGTIAIQTCGWTSTGSLPVVITYPDGRTETRTTQVNRSSDGGLEAYYYLDLGQNPQLGAYSLKFDGNSRNMYADFRLVRPSTPRLYTLSNGDVILWNFRPNEQVFLFAYEIYGAYDSAARFLAYQEFYTNMDGTLYINVNMSRTTAYAAFGLITGQVAEYGEFKPVIVDDILQ